MFANAVSRYARTPPFETRSATMKCCAFPMLMHEIGNPLSVLSQFEPRALTDNDVNGFSEMDARDRPAANPEGNGARCHEPVRRRSLVSSGARLSATLVWDGKPRLEI